MKTFHDYESMGAIQNIEEAHVPVLETLSGSQVASWYTMIENFLQQKLDDQEAARNFENADRLRAFLNTWRDNELTGSISVDQLRPLKAAAEQAAAIKSGLRPIFTSVLRNLRKLIADEEELPRGIDQNATDPMAGGGLGSAPPMSPDFGPEEEKPGEPKEGEELGPEGLEQPGDEEDKALDKIMAAAESLPQVIVQSLSEQDSMDEDLKLFREVMAEFQSVTRMPMDRTTKDEFIKWVKGQVGRWSIKQKVMCLMLFKWIFLKGADEAAAWQHWAEKEPYYRNQFETDPDTLRKWQGMIKWDQRA